MEVYSAGYQHSHSSDYAVNCSTGAGVYLLLIFKTKAFYYADGEKHLADSGSFVIYSPDYPCRYGACGQDYADDWIRFSMDNTDMALLSALGIQLNEVTKIKSSVALSEIVHKVAFETAADNPFRHDVMQLFMQMLFFRIGQFKKQESTQADTSITHYHRLVRLRNELAQNPQQHIDVEELAKSVYMSKSHFQHTYKRLFGASVLEDCSRFRMRDAAYYLSSTDMTVKEVSYHCGYNSEPCFIRTFKKRFMMTPTEYRQSM